MKKNQNIEIELVTFEEWLDQLEEREIVELADGPSEPEFEWLYGGYWNWCWFRMCHAEPKEEVKKRYVKEVK